MRFMHKPYDPLYDPRPLHPGAAFVIIGVAVGLFILAGWCIRGAFRFIKRLFHAMNADDANDAARMNNPPPSLAPAPCRSSCTNADIHRMYDAIEPYSAADIAMEYEQPPPLPVDIPMPAADYRVHADMARFIKELREWGGGVMDAMLYRNIVNHVETCAKTCGDPSDGLYIIDAFFFNNAVWTALNGMHNEIEDLPKYYDKIVRSIISRTAYWVFDDNQHGAVDYLLALTRTVFLEHVWECNNPPPPPPPGHDTNDENGCVLAAEDCAAINPAVEGASE